MNMSVVKIVYKAYLYAYYDDKICGNSVITVSNNKFEFSRLMVQNSIELYCSKYIFNGRPHKTISIFLRFNVCILK